jgi:phosphoglycolate phosphatase-like HAD superfamily hydrolase
MERIMIRLVLFQIDGTNNDTSHIYSDLLADIICSDLLDKVDDKLIRCR